MAITLRDNITFPFNDGRGIRVNQLDGAVVESADAVNGVVTLTVRDASNAQTTVVIDGAAHHNGVGPPTDAPTRAGQISIDNEGKVYASGDQIIDVATHPTITTHTVGPGQNEWNMWRGAGLDSSLQANGQFQWSLTTHTLRQRRNGSRANRTWEEIVQYIEDESLGFPTGISAATISLGLFDSEEDAALAAAHLTGFDLNTGTYIFIHEDVVGASHDFRLKRVLTYTAGATTPTDVLFWRPSPLTRREIFDLISEQATLHRPVDKPKQVSSIPTTEDEPVLNLTHNQIVAGGTADHQMVTIGDAAGLYGYSDGQALQQTFGTITGNSPVSFITGPGVGTGSSITSFTPEIVGSHNRGFIEEIRTIVIDGTDYTLSDLDYRYGAFRREIMSGPRITDGNFTFNFKDVDGNLYFRTATNVENVAGLYWWNSILTTPAYERLGKDHFQSTYNASRVYFFGDYVRYLAQYWISVSNDHSGNTPTSISVHWDQITGLVPEPSIANFGRGIIIGSDGRYSLSNGLYRGPWSATVSYRQGDSVFHNDAVWQSLSSLANLNNEPNASSTAWSSGQGSETLFGRGEPPEANADRVGMRFLDLTSKVLYGCFDDPHSTTSSTGDFDDIARTDIEINLNDILEDIPVVENEWLYRVASNRFYAGTDVGSNQLAWVDDTADDALAASLVTNTDEVVWLGRHIDNEEALNGLTAIESGKEYFFYREVDGTIVRLDNSTFTAAGSVVAHPFWFPVKADDREEHIFDARDGLPTLANDGSDDNRIGIVNDGVYIVDVDPINATDPTADSWADYTATDYEGAFASDPTIDTGHWYANYVRKAFREFESTNFGLGWIPHDAPTEFIGWYDSRQDALNHAAERGVASGGNFVAFTGTTGTPKVETATNFTPATSARVQRNWVFISVGGSGSGFTFRQGSVVPANSLGIDNDWYLNTTTGGFYEKVSGSWVLRYTDQVGAGGGLTQAQVDARITTLAALLAGATFTGAVSGIAPTTDAHFATKQYVDDNAGDVTGIDAGTGIRIDDGDTPTPEVNVRHDNTLQVDNSGDLGVNTQRVVQEVSEWVQHFATGDSHDTSGHSGKYQLYTSSNTHRRIGSVEYHFDPENDSGNRTFQVFVLELTGQNVDVILGSSDVYSGDDQQHRFHFTDGVMINPNVRIGIGLHRTDGGNNEGLRVRSGAESQDSPRESYDDASSDFNFVGRFNHDRPTPTVGDTVGGTANGQIYGNPEIFYQIIHTHASLVGDGNISAAHINSGSAAADAALLADGSSGAAFRAVVVHGGNIVDNTIPTAKYGNLSVTNAKIADVAASKVTGTLAASAIPGSLTHRQAQAVTVNGNVLDIPTEAAVQGGDTVLFVVPTPWTATGNLTVRVTQGGVVQANTTLALNDRVGTRLTGSDIVAEEEMEIILATDWRSLVHPIGSGTGTTVTANPSGTDGDDLTRLSISGTNYNIAGQISWGFVIDTLIVPELNQDAITAARIVLEDSALTHYLAFLDWTQANLDMISHLPVGAHIGLRQDTTIRILRVEAEWDSTNNRYQVININAGGLLEQASGTATELLLTAGVLGGGDTVLDRPKQVVSIPSAFDEALLYLTHDELATGGAAAHETITVGEDSGAFGYSDGTALPVTLGSTTGSSPVAFITGDGAESSGTITSFTPNVIGSHHRDFMDTYTTIVIDGTDYTLDDVVFRFGAYRRSINSPPTITDGNFTYNFKNASDNLYFTDADTTNEAGLWQWEEDSSPAAYERVGSGGDSSGTADLKGQRIASIMFGAVPTSGSSLETSASGSGTRLDSGDIGGTGSDVGWIRDTDAPTAFTVERIGASSDEPIINVPHTRPATNAFGYLVELEILPFLGTLSNAISAVATSIIFTAESTEDIAIGDDLRIENEVVTVDTVPADGATGEAARTYGIERGQDGTDAATHTNTRAVQKNVYELESDGIILQGGPSPQQGGSSSRSTISLGTGGLQDATGIREIGVRLNSNRSTTGLSGLEQVRLIDLISQGDNAVLLPSTRITIYLAVIAGGTAESGGQESPGNEGVAELTANLVTVTLYKWVLTTDGKPVDPTAHWRFDDEWNGTTPFQGGGWYVSRATALDEADNNPAFSEDTWTLWVATEQVRRRVVNDAYSYTDGGYTVTAAWDIQYSIDGSTWTTTEPTDVYHYIRYRDQETGTFGPTIPIGTNVGSNDWQPIRTNDLVYPGGSNEDELDAVYDFGNFSELLFIVAGYRSISVGDGMGGTVIVGVNGPLHQFVLNRGGGWPVADISENEDNNDADDGSCFQFTYFATNTGVGLQIWERGDELSEVNPGNPPFLQSDGEPPIQMGGHFKIVSTDGDEAHVTKFRFFAFSHAFARTTMSIFARYR